MAGRARVLRALEDGVRAVPAAWAAPLLDTAGEQVTAAYTAGLMAFRRPVPAPLRPASLGARAAVIGAAEVAFDAVLTDHGLTEWAARA